MMQQDGLAAPLLKLATLALIVAAIGLPINNLADFTLLVAAVLAVATGLVTTNRGRWLAAAALTLLVVAAHVWLPAPRIEEGHNVFLVDAPGSALEKGLPASAFRLMKERFDAAYPAERRCAATTGCWRPGAIPTQAFALAADGMLGHPAYSRRVAGIDFDSATWLRLGVINSLSLDIVGHPDDVERVARDRRSLALIGRWRLLLPYFVMYRFPADFVGAQLCWQGEVLWEGAAEQFDRMVNQGWGCRALGADDIGKRIFGVSIGPDATLAMSLDTGWGLTARRMLTTGATLIGVFGVWFLLIRLRSRRAVLPLLFGALALIVIVAIDITFIGGYRPFEAGDDGLIFSGFARVMLQALARGDLMGVLEGAEKIYGFTAGMRYFRFAEYLAFGDSFLGYLLLMLALPLVVYRLCARFIGTDWALAFTLLFVATPAGALFGTSYLHHITWAARGYADPLGAMAFFAGLIALAGRERAAPAFFGALLMAVAIVLRPNLVLGVAVLLAGVGLAALWRWQITRLAALCLGFVPVFFPLWHNWYFGGRIVLFSDILTNANIYMVAPVIYLDALRDIAHLHFMSDNLGKIARQLAVWLSGPLELAIMIPLHLAALAIVIRVACSRRFERMLRLTALATLALTPPAFVYLAATRYHLVLWLLATLVAAAWLQREGLALIDARWPNVRIRLANTAPAAWTGRALTRLAAYG